MENLNKYIMELANLYGLEVNGNQGALIKEEDGRVRKLTVGDFESIFGLTQWNIIEDSTYCLAPRYVIEDIQNDASREWAGADLNDNLILQGAA